MKPDWMQFIVAGSFLLTGVVGVFKPDFYYNRTKLRPEQIARNKRIWNRIGAILIVLGVSDLILALW